MSPRWSPFRGPGPLHEWFEVGADDTGISWDVHPRRRRGWAARVQWSEVQGVMFQREAPPASDGIYLFTTQRPEPFVVPLDASGGQAVWDALIARGLFPAELAATAAAAEPGEQVRWPET